jgi:ABC-type branched-subunit amino acid transport system substrate-binding protein
MWLACLEIRPSGGDDEEISCYRDRRCAAACVRIRCTGPGKVSDGVVKIGMLEHMSSIYADITGVGAVIAAKMAVEDFGGKVLGKPIEVIAADHQNKPDILSATAREWFDTQHVDSLLDVAASATALAAIELAKAKNKIIDLNGPGATRITNEACTPVSIHYMLLTNAFYWDRNEELRAWAQRYFQRMSKMPNMTQAGIYSATTHYLKAVEAAGTDATPAVLEKMHSTPINDFFVKNGKIREDGRMVHEMYLYEVKKPAESKRAWDYYKLIATIPADQAFQPLSESKCPLVKKMQ